MFIREVQIVLGSEIMLNRSREVTVRRDYNVEINILKGEWDASY